MFKKAILLLSIILYISRAEAAQYTVYLTIADSTIISYVTPQGKPVFTIAGINNIVNQYTVTGFQKLYPTSRFSRQRRIYKLTTNSLNLCSVLQSAYSNHFLHWEQEKIPETLAVCTPNDFVNNFPVRSEYLEYIRAEDAWCVTNGDPNVVIGVTDTWLDVNHEDLYGKIAQLGSNVYPVGDVELQKHGTEVTGAVAAATNNWIGYPAIGFNCRVDFSNIWGSDNELLLMSRSPRSRRVLTGSWMYNSSPNLNLNSANQRIYQEIYENGTFACIAAGNQKDCGQCPISPWYYRYPACYDYVFSTSSVGWEDVYGTSNGNEKGVHQFDQTDSNASFTHNPRVDLMAPAVRVGCLTYRENDPNYNYEWDSFWGTSIASPQVAGTAGLILSVNQCYTPYQLEYILKKSADNTVLSLAENLKYTGRLGAGALDAGNALAMVDPDVNNVPLRGAPKLKCNDPGTQTFFIEGIEVNTICAPGFSSNGALPTLSPVLRNGTPNYTYRWEYLPGNNVTLSSLTVANPQITTSTGNRKAELRLTVYDGSDVQKVASRYFTIQLTTANTYDLAGRDSYMDMLDEPNSMTLLDSRENQYYISPDLWNRQANDGGTVHQNAEYYLPQWNQHNYAHIKVRNVGCGNFNGTVTHFVKLYWTIASTGENWKYDWDGTTQLQSAGGGLPNLLPAGGEITSGNGISIPALQPGQSATLVQQWDPVKPEHYFGAPSDLNVCLLARIVNPADLVKQGMAFHEVTGQEIINNVRPNNNIFTRNLWVMDLNPLNRTVKTRVLIANARDVAQTFDVQFINDRAINLQFAGNFSEIGYVKLYLGALYNLWLNAGANGSYLQRNDDQKWVIMDGSRTLELLNIPFPANAKYPVDVEFTLYPGAEIPDYRYDFHLRQFAVYDAGRSDDVYGSMSFRINTDHGGDVGKPSAIGAVAQTEESTFRIYPNPAKDKLTISYLANDAMVANITITDLLGRVMLRRERQHFNKTIDVPLTGLSAGVYFVEVSDGKGIREKMKFVKE